MVSGLDVLGVVHVAPRCAVAAYEGGMALPQWQGLHLSIFAQKLHKVIAPTAQAHRHTQL
jgi:hypothetical protein|tara:strand:+ start:1613 stop:1792 length:180 start_codon:yes stop_codon:yes gene_type:complete